jgi:hypothetical protein
VKVKKFNIADT